MKKSEAQIEAVKQICNSLSMDSGNGFNVHQGQKQLFSAFRVLENEGICKISACEHSDSGLFVVKPITGRYIQ